MSLVAAHSEARQIRRDLDWSHAGMENWDGFSERTESAATIQAKVWFPMILLSAGERAGFADEIDEFSSIAARIRSTGAIR